MSSDGGLDVLVVEDDALNAQLLTRLCRSMGHTPRIAGDGAAALAAVARRRPDLVLLDLMLPIIDGFGVLAQLRGDPQTAALPVIMVTAVSEPATLAKLVDLGADDIVGKPFRFKELGQQIESTVAARKFLAGLPAPEA
jgi:CheY-like chemotaxis protein